MNFFDIQAQNKERWFFNRLKKSISSKGLYPFFTGKGRSNAIMKVTSDAIFLRSKKGKKMNRISREKLKQAIRFMFYKRTCTRKELEAFSHFYSALMGLLRPAFYEIAKIVKTSSGLLRISLKGTRFFPSSAERSPRDLEIAKEQGFSIVLMSYFSLRDDLHENWKFHCRRLGLKVLVDSGAFSAWRAAVEGKEVEPIEVEDYARFLLKHQDIVFGAFTLDEVGDPEATRENTEYLRSQGLNPIEIWHVQSPWEVLDQMIAEKDHPVIGIGGSVKLSEEEREAIFKELFRRHSEQNFHFLGGSSKLLYQFPWFTSDSKAWSFCGRMGEIITPAGHRKAPKHWSAEECIAFNAQQLRELEDNYDRSYQMSMLIPPFLSNQQLALF